MKKLTALLLSLTLVFSLAACGSNPQADETDSANAETSEPETSEEIRSTESSDQESATPQNSGTNALVIYFSMQETTNPDNMTQEEDNSAVVVDGEVLGNTQYVAYIIQENTGADIFRIQPETPYPTNHDTLVDLAAEEQDNDARPAIKDSIENLEQYDTVFIGYPNWWGDMPMILYSLFDEYDFSGKTIVPFNTHGGSGFSNTINTIMELEPNANIDENGFTVSRNAVQDAKPNIIKWLETSGYTR